MNNGLLYHPNLLASAASPVSPARKSRRLLRLIRAARPITRTDIIERLRIDRSTVTENVKPLIAMGLLVEDPVPQEANGRRSRELSFAGREYFIVVDLGVRHSQVGTTMLRTEIESEVEFETPAEAHIAIRTARRLID